MHWKQDRQLRNLILVCFALGYLGAGKQTIATQTHTQTHTNICNTMIPNYVGINTILQFINYCTLHTHGTAEIVGLEIAKKWAEASKKHTQIKERLENLT